MNVTIVKLTGPRTSTTRANLGASSAHATALECLNALVPLPPGWFQHEWNAYFAGYIGPLDQYTNLQLILAQAPADRINFLG